MYKDATTSTRRWSLHLGIGDTTSHMHLNFYPYEINLTQGLKPTDHFTTLGTWSAILDSQYVNIYTNFIKSASIW